MHMIGHLCCSQLIRQFLSIRSRRGLTSALGLGLTMALFVFAKPTVGQTYVIFDAQPQPSDTRPVSINQLGYIVGRTASPQGHIGFVRDPAGNSSLFSVNGATTEPSGINDNGQVVGACFDCGRGDSNKHGFLRDADGTITVFDPPDALNTTPPLGINNRGQIIGQYQTTSNQVQGFIRGADGSFTILDHAPLPCTGAPLPFAINNVGEVLGTCSEGPFRPVHGLVLDAQGNFTIFDPPGSAGANLRILAPDMDINASGQVTSCFLDSSNNYHCFVRDQQGNFSIFDLPGTQPAARSISDTGAVTGVFYSGGWRGFLRDNQGNLTFFDVPQQTTTEPFTMNNSGVIAGWCTDSNSNPPRGFVRIPPQP